MFWMHIFLVKMVLTVGQAEESGMTGTWFRALQYYSQCLGGWRRRRQGLANIMVDPGVA